jgi:GNAT superfamily N-acetyltransferase
VAGVVGTRHTGRDDHAVVVRRRMGDEPGDAGAGYVHRLAARRPTAGIGVAMLAWGAAQCRDRGLHRLRLDCVTTNQELRRYYEQRGFVHERDVVVTGPPSDREQCQVAGEPTTVSLYEMVL